MALCQHAKATVPATLPTVPAGIPAVPAVPSDLDEPLMLWEILVVLWWKGGDGVRWLRLLYPSGSRYVRLERYFLVFPMTWGWDWSTINPTRSGGVWILRVMIKFQMWIWERCYYPPVLVQRLQEANYTIVALFSGSSLLANMYYVHITYHKCKKGD